MSWDEKLFRWSLDKTQSLFGKKPDADLDLPNQILLADISPRLKVLASALAKKSIDVKEAESVGGVVGDTIFLPKRIALAPDPNLNMSAYLYRVAFSSTLNELAIRLPEEFHEQPAAQFMFSVLAVPTVRAEMKAIYPGSEQIEADLIRLELANRSTESGDKNSEPWNALIHGLLHYCLGEARVSAKPWVEEILSEFPIPRAALREKAIEFLQKVEPRPSHVRKELMPAIWGLVLAPSSTLLSGARQTGAAPKAKSDSLSTGTEKKGKPKERIEEIKLREDKEGENPLVHSFEKVHTLDDYIGGRKVLDGADEMEEHLEALQELDLRKVIRTHERSDSIYKADVMIDSGVGDLDDSTDSEIPQFIYDEWDFDKRSYKKDWCKVFVENDARALSSEVVQKYLTDVRERNRRQTLELRRRFEEFTYVRRWSNRQPDGPEIDIDAVVDRYTTLKSGHSPSTFVYLSRRPRERDFATLVLLDSSLSTDSWMMNRRVMDIMKESMLVLGEVIAEYHDRLAIGAFYSNTRKDCRYVEVKKFDETWARCQPKLVSLHPTGYTRIGPALRHGTHLLNQVKARKKLLLLISDGKPTDYDRYEGRYGIEDIRQAIREASKENVTVRALAIEAEAKFYLPQMFGTGNYQILPNPSLLAQSLAEIYGWLSV